MINSFEIENPHLSSAPDRPGLRDEDRPKCQIKFLSEMRAELLVLFLRSHLHCRKIIIFKLWSNFPGRRSPLFALVYESNRSVSKCDGIFGSRASDVIDVDGGFAPGAIAPLNNYK